MTSMTAGKDKITYLMTFVYIHIHIKQLHIFG